MRLDRRFKFFINGVADIVTRYRNIEETRAAGVLQYLISTGIGTGTVIFNFLFIFY